jgi:hypothetical protein
MYISNIFAPQPALQVRNGQQTTQSTPSTPDRADTARPSSSQGGSYDFTSLTPKDFTKNVNELFKAGKISLADWGVALTLTMKLPGDPNPTGPKNFLESLQRQLNVDKQNGVAVPGQVEREQSFLDTLTALQGTPKGVDKTA